MKNVVRTFLATLAIAALFQTTACVRTTSRGASSAEPKIEIIQTDFTLMTAQIRGLRAGMSPRMVYKRLRGAGFTESSFSRETLEDVILRSSRDETYQGHVILSKGESTLNQLDNETLSLKFCFGGLESISLRQTILLTDFERAKKSDLKKFPKAVQEISKNKIVLFSAKYKPDKISSAYISYVNRGHKNYVFNGPKSSSEPIITRNIDILEQTRCHNKEMRRIDRLYR